MIYRSFFNINRNEAYFTISERLETTKIMIIYNDNTDENDSPRAWTIAAASSKTKRPFVRYCHMTISASILIGRGYQVFISFLPLWPLFPSS